MKSIILRVAILVFRVYINTCFCLCGFIDYEPYTIVHENHLVGFFPLDNATVVNAKPYFGKGPYLTQTEPRF